MFELEEPLLHDAHDLRVSIGNSIREEPYKQKQNHNNSTKWKGTLLCTGTLMTVTFTIFFIICLTLYTSSTTRKTASLQPLDSISAGDSPIGTPSRDLRFSLHPEVHVSRAAGVRSFSWEITKKTASPDGVQKKVFLINSQFPGPTIEARSGDTLEIEIFNSADEGISIHWHGLHMRGANHMDGPVGITQCAIKPGGNFTYRVPTNDQAGTFWYHAHSEVQRGDGLYGGLVVHNPNLQENISFQYDEELLFLVGDWYHRASSDVLANYMSRTSTGIEPSPDSLLINGLGYFDCSMATHGSLLNCSEVDKPELSLSKQTRYRVRLLNVGSMTGISLKIADSDMKIIQVDGGLPVVPQIGNSVGILYPAERIDFILSWPKDSVITDTEIIIDLDKEYFLRPNFALTPTQSFHLSAFPTAAPPTTRKLVNNRINLQNLKGVSLEKSLPDVQKTFMIYTTVQILERLGSIPKGYINRTTWETPSVPLIMSTRASWDPSHLLVPWTGPEPVWVEITINNIDNNGHPFHLHGYDFYVVASYEGKGGWDYYNPFNKLTTPRGGPFNLIDPLVKDTIYVPPWGYVVIRFIADNAGFWTLHCHVLWHQGSGMTMALQVLGEESGGIPGEDAAKLW